MADINKALEEYRKSLAGMPEKNKKKGSVEKFVFKKFEDPDGRENIDSRELDNRKKQDVEENSGTVKNDYFIKETSDDISAQKHTLKGLQKVAKVLLLLGRDEAASVLKHFKPEEIEKIAAEVIKIRQIDKKEAAGLLSEIKKKAELKDTFSGGVETARKILHKAFGSEKGEAFLNKSLPETREKPFDFLEDFDPLQIKIAMKDEPVSMVSLIMNYLKPDKSAAILTEYPLEKQNEIIRRMASGGKVRSEIIEKMEQVIKEKVRHLGNNVSQPVDGKSRLANILKFMDLSDEEKILAELSDLDPALSTEISSQVYTIDIVHDIPDMYMQKILLDFTEKEIAVVLKGRDKTVKDKILSAMSKTRRTLVEQESDYLGIMRKSDVNIVTREFIDYIKQAEKDRDIIINRQGDVII